MMFFETLLRSEFWPCLPCPAKLGVESPADISTLATPFDHFPNLMLSARFCSYRCFKGSQA